MVSSRLARRLRHYGFQTFTKYYNYLVKRRVRAELADDQLHHHQQNILLSGAPAFCCWHNCCCARLDLSAALVILPPSHMECRVLHGPGPIPSPLQFETHVAAPTGPSAAAVIPPPSHMECRVLHGPGAHTIAITVRDTLAAPAAWDIKILASDIDTDVLAQAERGIYGIDTLEDVPPVSRKRHFLRGPRAPRVWSQ